MVLCNRTFDTIAPIYVQIALLRIGMTDPDRSTGILLTQDEVMAALATPLPSELLLKGTVANEVLQMENKLEDKVSCCTCVKL